MPGALVIPTAERAGGELCRVGRVLAIRACNDPLALLPLPRRRDRQGIPEGRQVKCRVILLAQQCPEEEGARTISLVVSEPRTPAR